jgi:hypothetical protein
MIVEPVEKKRNSHGTCPGLQELICAEQKNPERSFFVKILLPEE